MNRFERIARVIRHLETHHTQQPDLANRAQVAGMSPYYFHRLWAARLHHPAGSLGAQTPAQPDALPWCVCATQ